MAKNGFDLGKKKIQSSKTLMRYIRTPKYLFDYLNNEFNFTVDACASDKNFLIDKYWTKNNSALDKNWDNEIVYCHPLFDSNIPKFVKKAVTSNCLTVFLLPSSTFSKYFHDYFWDNKNHCSRKNIQIRFLSNPKFDFGHKDKRYKFFTEDMIEPDYGYLRPLMVVVVDKRKKIYG